MDKSIFSRDYETFLRHLRAARVGAGLTQVQLAERLSQTQSFVSKCERGERRLDLVEARAFCLALGVSFSAFVTKFEDEVHAAIRSNLSPSEASQRSQGEIESVS